MKKNFTKVITLMLIAVMMLNACGKKSTTNSGVSETTARKLLRIVQQLNPEIKLIW